jgi:hypothetical protein
MSRRAFNIASQKSMPPPSLYVAVTRVTARQWSAEVTAGGSRMKQVRHADAQDFAVILMLAAVATAITQVVGVAIDIGRAAGWWH